MKISARNQLKGKVIKITSGAVNATITIELINGEHIIANVTNRAVAELELTVGQEAYAVIKASDVMIGID